MRTFIAVGISDAVREKMLAVQEVLKTSSADVKWVSPRNAHLTLTFMGDCNPKKVPVISSLLSEVASRHAAFEARLSTLGAFPSLTAPRVIWLGIGTGKETLTALADDLAMTIAHKAGIPREKRPFAAHLTLGRVRSPKNRVQLTALLQKQLQQPLTTVFPIDRLTFYQSTLSPQGPHYEVLQEVNLTIH